MRLDAGKLFVMCRRGPGRAIFRCCWRAAGRARRSGAFEIIAAAEATIDTWRAGRVHVATDGEVVTLRPPLSYRSRPGALRAVLPRP